MERLKNRSWDFSLWEPEADGLNLHYRVLDFQRPKAKTQDQSVMNDAFTQVLERNRAVFNARFAQARQMTPSLDGDDFASHLREVVSPIVVACDTVSSERTHEVVEVLYELSLQLMSKGLLGRNTRNPLLQKAWMQLLPHLAPQIVRSPRRVVGSVCNAVVMLSQTPRVRTESWMQLMQEIAANCDDVETFLSCGRVAAWRCGMAHTREIALRDGRELPANIVRHLFELPDETTSEQLNQMWTNLKSDVWISPTEAATSSTRSSGLKLVAQVGDFRGFGGHFQKPPRVTTENGAFYISDSSQSWRIFADVFGATLLRAHVENLVAASSFASVPDWNRVLETFPEAQHALSTASDGKTVAVTLPTSHRVYLLT